MTPAAFDQPDPDRLRLTGEWTALCIGEAGTRLQRLTLNGDAIAIDGSGLEALDSVGVWLLQRRFEQWREQGREPRLVEWPLEFAKLMTLFEPSAVTRRPATRRPPMERIGRWAATNGSQLVALLDFIGRTALSFFSTAVRPARWRVRPTLKNIQTAGVEALPIVGLTAFLLGVVVAYQSADQLRRYGANIFVVDLIGFAMLREFAPLITAIIVAGRSGSAYAAQIGTMSVTEEIDALRTIGIPPIDQLVLPKIMALLVALPLLTLFADVVGVLGGATMAASKLGIGFAEFFDRFGATVGLASLLVGAGKALVFAIIITVVGCFQGFQTRGGPDSVGRQTTRSVVQAIFLVIVADAIFSVLFSMLEI